MDKLTTVWDDVNDNQFTVSTIDDYNNNKLYETFQQQTIDLGESTWGERYKFKPKSISRVSRAFANAHYDQRIYKRKELMVLYCSSKAVRDWCKPLHLDLIEIRDMRSTTDWYDNVIMPVAGKWYAEYHAGQHPEAINNGLYHFVKTLMAAILLTEETTFMDVNSITNVKEPA